MNKLFYFFLALMLSSNLSSKAGYGGYPYMYVQNPDFWGQYYGEIDAISIDATPQGLYTQFDVFLTFSSGEYLNYYNHYNENDSLEVQYFFSLPKEAIITDSWLWVEDEVVIADIRDRWSANEIYEGIVNRRKDPSILYKNSATDYEFRIYPLVANETRKVKLTILLPNKWTGSSVSCDLPLNFLSVLYTPDVYLKINSNDIWKNPTLKTTAYNQKEGYIDATISKHSLHETVTLSYDAPLTDGAFLQKYPTSYNSGYYQLAFKPSSIIDHEQTQNLAVVFDHDDSYTSYSKQSVWEHTRETLKDILDENDKFNVFYTKFITKQASDSWIEATDEKIDSVFNALWEKDPLSSHPVLPAVLGAANEFISLNNDEGKIILISSSAAYANRANSDQLISDYETLGNIHPVSVADYFNSSSPSFYYKSTRYYGNTYLYEGLTNASNGDYASIKTFSSLASTIQHAIFSSTSSFESYDIRIDIGDFGFSYSDFKLTPGDKLLLDQTYMITGKYFGEEDFVIKLRTESNGVSIGGSKTISDFFVDTDSASFQIWAAQKINELEASGYSNSINGEIIELSLASRVLSENTAFLALDPNEFDNVTTCNDCEYLVGIDEALEDAIAVSVYPNPFVEQMSISLNLPSGLGGLPGKVQLLSLDGKVLLEFDFDSSIDEQELAIALSEYGIELNDGMYLLNIQIGDYSKMVKITKM